MDFHGTLLVVSHMEKSKQFYQEILNLQVVMDFGANVTLTGGISLQTQESWISFIGVKKEDLCFGNNTTELYFEEEDFDAFLEKLEAKKVHLVHPVLEHRWGQRVIRFYDPDQHMIEVGERMRDVCLRFLRGSLTMEEISLRMEIPLELVKELLQ